MRWGQGQSITPGYILEDLGSFGLGPLDQWADRIMSDTTTQYIVEHYELWSQTGDDSFAIEWYPVIAKALRWLIQNADTNGQGLPYQLCASYDIINFQIYNTTTYNAVLYLTALQAGFRLATLVNDTATMALVQEAFIFGQAQIDALLWNSTYGR